MRFAVVLGLVLALASVASACTNGNLITFNGERARQFGSVTAVLLPVIAISQVLRTKFRRPTWYVALAAGAPFLLNRPDWNYYGLKGDCGILEYYESRNLMLWLGALTAFQVAAWIVYFRNPAPSPAAERPREPIAHPGE